MSGNPVNVASLAEAVQSGDLARVRAMLQSRPELVHMDMAANNEHRALHYAVLRRDPAMVRLLMEAGADPRKGIFPHRDATSALALARDREYPEIVAILGQEEPPRRAGKAPSDGPLTVAVKQGDLEMVRCLLDQGADVDERILLAELEEPTESWGSPLWHAALAKRRDIVELLLDRGADPNANVYASGWPLRNAWDDEPLRRLLIERGAKVQPYMVAEFDDVAEAARILEAGASEAVVGELVWSAACHGSAGVLRLALPRQNWPANDPRWNWVLIQPIRGIADDGADHEGFFICMDLLLQHGVAPDVSSRFGQTPLHFAAGRSGPSESERARFVGMLLDHGANYRLRDELLKSTPLGWACRWGRIEMVKLLIARGAPANEPDAEPWATPLAWAEKTGHTEIAALLRGL